MFLRECGTYFPRLMALQVIARATSYEKVPTSPSQHTPHEDVPAEGVDCDKPYSNHTYVVCLRPYLLFDSNHSKCFAVYLCKYNRATVFSDIFIFLFWKATWALPCNIAQKCPFSCYPTSLLISRFLCVCGGRFGQRTVPRQNPQSCVRSWRLCSSWRGAFVC